MVKVGQRIELVSMPQEPNAMEPGTQGTVEFINPAPMLRMTQIGVKWDNGRTLMLSVPPDQFKIIK